MLSAYRAKLEGRMMVNISFEVDMNIPQQLLWAISFSTLFVNR
jgi:hypothetical protein